MSLRLIDALPMIFLLNKPNYRPAQKEDDAIYSEYFRADFISHAIPLMLKQVARS